MEIAKVISLPIGTGLLAVLIYFTPGDLFATVKCQSIFQVDTHLPTLSKQIEIQNPTSLRTPRSLEEYKIFIDQMISWAEPLQAPSKVTLVFTKDSGVNNMLPLLDGTALITVSLLNQKFGGAYFEYGVLAHEISHAIFEESMRKKNSKWGVDRVASNQNHRRIDEIKNERLQLFQQRLEQVDTDVIAQITDKMRQLEEERMQIVNLRWESFKRDFLKTALHELFADSLPVISSHNPSVIADSWTIDTLGITAKMRLFNPDSATRRKFTKSFLRENVEQQHPHLILSPVRWALWSKIKDLPHTNESSKRILQSFFRILNKSYSEYATLADTTEMADMTDVFEHLNQTLISRIKNEL